MTGLHPCATPGCIVLIPHGRRLCHGCQRTLALMEEGRCVSCFTPTDGLVCYDCRYPERRLMEKNAAVGPVTRHLLNTVHQRRYNAKREAA